MCLVAKQVRHRALVAVDLVPAAVDKCVLIRVRARVRVRFRLLG